MKTKVPLETRRLFMRTLMERDITSQYIHGLNDPAVNYFLINVRLKKQTKQSVGKFVTDNLHSPEDNLMGIFIKQDNALIGTIRIHSINRYHGYCSVGICIFDKNAWGKRYGVEALRKAVQYIFKDLKLHYIEAGVYKNNVASLKLFKRAGFSVQTIIKNKYRHIHNYQDVYFFKKLNDKYL